MKFLLIFLLPLFFLGCSKRNSFEVKDAYESLKAGEKKEFYFAFAKGDTISLHLEVSKGMLSEFTLKEYPNEVKFTATDFNDTIEKKILVTQTNCFSFSANSNQGCKFHYTIVRIPGPNTPENYSNKVEWTETKEERHYMEFVNLTEKIENITLCSSSGKYNPMSGCKADRVVRNYSLPSSTLYWVYELDVDNSQLSEKLKEHKDLFTQLNSSHLSADVKLTGDVMLFMSQPTTSGNPCDLFFFNTPQEQRIFESHQNAFGYNTELSKLNTQGISQRVKRTTTDNNIYIGFRNNSDYSSLKVAFQITAAVMKKEKMKQVNFQTFE